MPQRQTWSRGGCEKGLPRPRQPGWVPQPDSRFLPLYFRETKGMRACGCFPPPDPAALFLSWLALFGFEPQLLDR